VVHNDGLISGATVAAGLYGSGLFENSGDVSGGNFGFYMAGTVAGALLQNSGQVWATDTGLMLDGGTVTNTGTVTGLEVDGVILSAGTLINSNRIAGNFFGISASSSYVFNSGIISGATDAVYQASGNFTNDGFIASGNTGASFGNVNASNNGLLVGGSIGVLIAGGELYDSGVITGGEYAVEGTGAFDLVLNNTGVLNGQVTDRADLGQIDLVGSTPGTLSGLGSSITGFNSINIGQGGSWTLDGNIAGLASGQLISGFAQGDTIVLSDFAATSASYTSGVGLVLSNGATAETLEVAKTLATSSFIMTDDAEGVAITLGTAAPCFCAGTRIATARGNIAVEELAIGDLVRTAARGLQPIRWIGRRGYEGRFIAGNHLALPVKIRRHALGLNVPSRDLFVSPDHALAEGGCWCMPGGSSMGFPSRRSRAWSGWNISMSSWTAMR
jgi:hypothetical protein